MHSNYIFKLEISSTFAMEGPPPACQLALADIWRTGHPALGHPALGHPAQ